MWIKIPLKYSIPQIDYVIQNKTRSTYRWEHDYFDWVVSKPEEYRWLSKYISRIYKAFMVLVWEADAIKYSKYQ